MPKAAFNPNCALGGGSSGKAPQTAPGPADKRVALVSVWSEINVTKHCFASSCFAYLLLARTPEARNFCC